MSVQSTSIRSLTPEDYEAGLLGCIFQHEGQRVLDLCVSRGLTSKDFYKTAHSLVYDTMRAVAEAGEISELTVAKKIADDGNSDAVGGMDFLFSLSSKVDTTTHAEFFLGNVLDNSARRIAKAQIADIAGQLETCLPTSEVMLGSVEKLRLIAEKTLSSENLPIPSAQFAEDGLKEIRRIHALQGRVAGLPSGYSKLDDALHGLKPGELCIVAARPGVGKSALMLNMAYAMQKLTLNSPEYPHGCEELLFSLEMNATPLAMRLLSMVAKVNINHVYHGTAVARQMDAFEAAKNEISKMKIHVHESCGFSFERIAALMSMHQRRFGLHCVIVDYLQILKPEKSFRSEEERVADVTDRLKYLAMGMKIPIIALCQLNRESEKDERAPRCSDLRSSGTIEQTADVVLLIDRRDSRDNECRDLGQPLHRDILIAKNRNGPVGGIVPLVYDPNTQIYTQAA